MSRVTRVYSLWEKIFLVQWCVCVCFNRSVVSDSLWPLGLLQARILEWVAFPFSRGSSQPRDQTQVSHIVGRFFTIWATRELVQQDLNRQNQMLGSSVAFPENQIYRLYNTYKANIPIGLATNFLWFLSKNKRHIFHFHRELYWTNVFTISFHYLNCGASSSMKSSVKLPQTTFDTFDQSQHLLHTLHKSFFASVAFLPFLK